MTDDTGGLNAFHFGPDGMIYAPSWFRGQVVRIDPESGATTVLADGFHKPGAVRFDAADQLYVLDDESGELWALDRDGDGWRKRFIARHATATDNMAMGADGLIYVSNMADNGIDAVDPKTGAVRTIVAGALAFPRAIALAAGAGGRGDPRRRQRRLPHRRSAHRRGARRGPGGRDAAAIPEFGQCRAQPHRPHRRGSGRRAAVRSQAAAMCSDFAKFDKPSAAIELADGKLVVAEPIAGRLLMVDGDDRRTIAEGLDHPAALVDAGDGAVLVAESGSGKLIRVALADGAVTTVATGLGGCRAIAVVGDGTVIVLDATAGRLLSVHLAGGQATLIASGLPVGYLSSPIRVRAALPSAPTAASTSRPTSRTRSTASCGLGEPTCRQMPPRPIFAPAGSLLHGSITGLATR